MLNCIDVCVGKAVDQPGLCKTICDFAIGSCKAVTQSRLQLQHEDANKFLFAISWTNRQANAYEVNAPMCAGYMMKPRLNGAPEITQGPVP